MKKNCSLILILFVFLCACKKKQESVMIPNIDISIFTKTPSVWYLKSYNIQNIPQTLSECERRTKVNFKPNNLGSYEYDASECGTIRNFSWIYEETTKKMTILEGSSATEVILTTLKDNVWEYEYQVNNLIYKFRFEKQ